MTTDPDRIADAVRDLLYEAFKFDSAMFIENSQKPSRTAEQRWQDELDFALPLPASPSSRRQFGGRRSTRGQSTRGSPRR